MINTASVIGLGKLGSPMAAAIAARGINVVAVDNDPRKVDAINSGRPPVFEPGLAELLQSSKGRLKATCDIASAVLESDITFMVVATPSEPDGGFSLRYVLPVCEVVGQTLRSKPGHMVILTSTVLPGMTGGPVLAALEKASGKKCGRDFGLCYNPEFIALGSVIHDFLNPDFLLIGESDGATGDKLEALYKVICENQPKVARMNFVNAEITKLSVNTFVTTKISFANMLARICEQLPGANVDVVTSALGLDTRIGKKYLKGAISFGGPCFPRDNLALTALADQLGVPADIARVTHQFNRAQIPWLADLVCRQTGARETVGILGLTYKPNTDVVEQAAGILLAEELIRRGVSVTVYDPSGDKNTVAALGDRVRFTASPEECIAQTGVVVVATPWPEFAQIPAAKWARHASSRVVVDCWRALPHLDMVNGVTYLSLGTGTPVVVHSEMPAALSAESR